VVGNLVLYCVSGTWAANGLQALGDVVATARGSWGPAVRARHLSDDALRARAGLQTDDALRARAYKKMGCLERASLWPTKTHHITGACLRLDVKQHFTFTN
jgi:hypothetical protein